MSQENTFAFLIAVENYPEDERLPRLPQSFHNVSSLDTVLRKNIGIPVSNIKSEYDPSDAKALVEEIQKFVNNENAKTLIIYYAGHGIVDEDSSHYLTLKSSTVDNISIDGLDINYLNKAFTKNKNLNLVLILDSCFSENAFDTLKNRNYFVIASSAKNRTSIYPVDADYSAFTNELINVLKNGIDNQQKTLIWRDVYEQVRANLSRLSEEDPKIPLPKRSAQNDVDELEAGPNNFYKDEVSMDGQWIKIIQSMGRFTPKFKSRVNSILNSESDNVPNKLKDHLMNFFPFPIAYYLNKLFTRETTSRDFMQFYEGVIRFLFMVVFIEYESLRSSKGFKAGEKFKKSIQSFNQPDHDFYLAILESLSSDFRDNKSTWFLSEFDYFNDDFQSVIKNLEALRKKEDSPLEEVRPEVLKLLVHLDFMLNYKLVSVKDVNLSYRKYDPQAFNHHVSVLQGIEHTQYQVLDELTEDWQQAFVKNAKPKNNRSVLFINCKDPDNMDYLNLWPMIIDKGAVDVKANMPEVFLYSGIDGSGDYIYQNIRSKVSDGPKTLYDLEKFAVSTTIEEFNKLLKP